jgi:hypothetical protein
LEKRNLVDKG